jgi:hypothetical protein
MGIMVKHPQIRSLLQIFFFLDSTAETATAPTRCKVGGEHKSTHPVGRSKQSFF